MFARAWTLRVQTNAVTDFDKSHAPVFRVTDPVSLAEAHQGAQRVHATWEAENDVFIPGGQLSAICLFEGSTTPSWEDPACTGTVIMVDAEAHAVLCVFEAACLYAVGDSSWHSAQAYGVRLVRRRDDAYRVELWTRLAVDDVFPKYLRAETGLHGLVARASAVDALRGGTENVGGT